MASKTKFNSEPFKLQVYVDTDTVSKIDHVCTKTNMYRSGFVTEAINRLLNAPKYKKILEAK